MVLKQLLDQVHGQSKARAKKAILELSVVAAGWTLKRPRHGGQTADRLASDTFQIIVAAASEREVDAAERAAGKNHAARTGAERGRGPMPVGDCPARRH